MIQAGDMNYIGSFLTVFFFEPPLRLSQLLIMLFLMLLFMLPMLLFKIALCVVVEYVAELFLLNHYFLALVLNLELCALVIWRPHRHDLEVAKLLCAVLLLQELGDDSGYSLNLVSIFC